MSLRYNGPAAVVLLLALMVACGKDSSNPVTQTGPGTDTQPPEAINDLSLAYDEGNDAVRFTWTARRDDADHARPDHLDIRYGSSFPFDWERATVVDPTPTPAAPGTAQLYVLPHPIRGRDVYASVRAWDESGNESAAGNVGHVRVPGFAFAAVCTDAFSGAPVAGLDAVVTARTVHQLSTGADGRIELTDLAQGSLGVLLNTGTASTLYHSLSDVLTLDHNLSLAYPMIPFQDPQSDLYPSILALLVEAMFAPGSSHVVKHWPAYPVPVYIPDFVSSLGVDYHAFAVQAAERWNSRVGFPMFTPVAADPPVGVLMEFLPRSTMGTVNGVTDYTSTADGHPLHDRIRIVDDITDTTKLYLIVMHELGHTIRLGHLPAGFIMYGSQPLPPDISDDEVSLVQLLLALPDGTDLQKYDASPPAP
ncbi:MAG TPA: hypothetical protein VFH88_08200 [Candidatus Krumholzibacteria bacterium]|nr:hypothetical protein [Candidatus Krumholzibacteria bacterium]